MGRTRPNSHPFSPIPAATGKHLPYYGATLPSQNPSKSAFEANIDYTNLVYYQTDAPASAWISMQKTAINFHGTEREPPKDEFCSTLTIQRAEVVGRDPPNIDAYRSRWINDEDARSRTGRFTSVMNASLSASAPTRFNGAVERFLPGSVKSLEVLRARLVDVHGTDGILVLAQSFVSAGDAAVSEGLLEAGGGSMRIPGDRLHLAVADPRGFSRLALRAHLETVLRIRLTIDQEAELYNRFLDTAGVGKAHWDVLIAALLGHGLSDTRRAAVDRAWGDIQRLVALGAQKEAARARSPPRTSAHPSPLPPHSASGVTVATVRTAFDPSYHPDTRRKPLPLRSHAAATARLAAGLAVVLRQQESLGRVGESGSLQSSIDLVLASSVVPPGVDAMTEHAHNVYDGVDGTPVAYRAWEAYCAYLSAGVDGDETFTRLLDGCWHVELKPHLAATAPTYRESAPRRENGMYTTAATDVGSGLKYASKPYVPGAGRPVPVPPPSKLDLDAVVTQTGGPTHVTLLVTHADGRKSVQQLVRDRFMDTGDVPALLARLEGALGIRDGVDATLDF